MLSKFLSAGVVGIEGYHVDVEVYISNGLPSFNIVGLPDASVRESRDRVVSAIKNSGFDFPSKRITVSLAPSDIKKEGSQYDLAIALGILSARGNIQKCKVEYMCILGELALDGSLRKVSAVLPIVASLRSRGIKQIMLPDENAREAALVRGVDIIPVKNINEAVEFLNGEKEISFSGALDVDEMLNSDEYYDCDLSEIKGQKTAKRALEIAAAGSHNVLFVGPPGSGKTMLARRLGTILPKMTFEESLETTKIYSASGVLPKDMPMLTKRPFRSPHHTVSDVALIGGGSIPKAGEVSLSHNGVLFLDELTEFERSSIEALRQPLEENTVTIARARSTLTLPASFMLVASMNPCPCGNLGHTEKECSCTPYAIKKYRSKISGPVLDRIDIHIEVPALKARELAGCQANEETSKEVRSRVESARLLQKERFAGTRINANAKMFPKHIKKFCAIDDNIREFFLSACQRLSLSARAYDRVLKVARTIADLEGEPDILTKHIAEAISYRSLDRANFGLNS